MNVWWRVRRCKTSRFQSLFIQENLKNTDRLECAYQHDTLAYTAPMLHKNELNCSTSPGIFHPSASKIHTKSIRKKSA